MATSPPEARALAWRVLRAVEEGAFADAALGTALAAARLAPRDRALATQLVYGTLAWQGLLDHLLTNLGRPPAGLDAPIRVLLRLALFQLVKLDRVPAFAAVDTAVALAKTVHGGAASGLVNALLRRFLRAGRPLDLPPAGEAVAHLAVATSHPAWLVELWRDELGADAAAALLAADNTPAPTVLRARPGGRPALLAALAGAGIAAHPSRYAAHGVVLEQAVDPAALPGWRAGAYAVQGEASQLVTALVAAAPGQRVLDACAAPGGKALALAEMVGAGGAVVAIDRHHAGLRRLRGAARRLGVRVPVLQADATRLPLSPALRVDAVLVDAPCSGLGTLRQHPEIRWRRQPADLAALAAGQGALLDAAVAAVRPGGVVVYATCTIAAVENDAVVDACLARHPDLAREDARRFLPPPAQALVDGRGALRTFPHRDDLDGFFAVRLRRAA